MYKVKRSRGDISLQGRSALIMQPAFRASDQIFSQAQTKIYWPINEWAIKYTNFLASTKRDLLYSAQKPFRY